MDPTATHHIEVAWDDAKQRIIVCRFKEQWSWHECRDALQTVTYMHDSVEHEVSYIYDLTESRLTARAAMENVKKLIEVHISPTPRKIIIVDRSIQLRLLVDTLERLFPDQMPDNVEFADSLQRARAMLG